MRPKAYLRIVLVLSCVAATAAPVTLAPGGGVQPARAECQTGTCCPEDGSWCIIGDTQREDYYHKASGSCTGRTQPLPPP